MHSTTQSADLHAKREQLNRLAQNRPKAVLGTLAHWLGPVVRTNTATVKTSTVRNEVTQSAT
jgi:hypothetical protein